jgi:hypothetical protein
LTIQIPDEDTSVQQLIPGNPTVKAPGQRVTGEVYLTPV